MDSIPGQRTEIPHAARQLSLGAAARECVLQQKIPCAATKTWHSQIKKNVFKLILLKAWHVALPERLKLPLHVTLRRWTPFSVHHFFFFFFKWIQLYPSQLKISFASWPQVCIMVCSFLTFKYTSQSSHYLILYFSLRYHEVSEVLLSELFGCYLLSSAVFSECPILHLI